MSQHDWRRFLNLCLEIKDEKLLSEFFELFLTHEERDSIETRVLIVRALLEQKKPQRQISEDYNVSIAKITRGSNELKSISPKLKKFLNEKL
ncbi:MAG TPA: trp operon repressor [Gammaproteobacteria bacterium]|nr:trp operon repressor [Gammaproteobacteria bacterium]